MCDVWWENETEWHRDWKGHFPTEWQEVIHHADSGEKHIADVKTVHDWVLEFQHSYLKPEERRARDAFYKNLIWIVDGRRRGRDLVQFWKAWKLGSAVGNRKVIYRMPTDGCVLLREWAGCRAPVFFDFGVELGLWWLLPKQTEDWAHVAKFTHADFIALHQRGAKEKIDEFAKCLLELRASLTTPQIVPSPPLQGFQRYLARRPRRRF